MILDLNNKHQTNVRRTSNSHCVSESLVPICFKDTAAGVMNLNMKSQICWTALALQCQVAGEIHKVLFSFPFMQEFILSPYHGFLKH